MIPTWLSLGLTHALLAGLPWIRSSAVAEPKPAPRVVAIADKISVLASSSPEYQALAIPPSVRRNPDAVQRLVIFRNGLCVLDRGLIDSQSDGRGSSAIAGENGVFENGAVAPDGREAAVVTTRYDSRVDPAHPESGGEATVRSTSVLTLLDPAHPEGRWQLTLEAGRWVRNIEVLAASSGLVLTTFVPRNGPGDFRVLDDTGRERLRIAETKAETLAIASTCDPRCFVAADMKFRDDIEALPERGIVVFDLAKGTSWTYGWRYGKPEEPASWSLGAGGILTVKMPGSTKRFDPLGRHL